MIDSGNALFANVGPTDDAVLKARAHFVMRTMGMLGTKVMAAGARDLSAGAEFLKTEAKAAGITVLSANLTDSDKPVFAGSTIVTVGNVKVAFIGLTMPGPVPGYPSLKGTETAPAVERELKTLGKRDLTVVLASSTYADAQQLANVLKGKVELIIQSGEFRGTVPPQNFEPGYVLASGQKGQSIAKLELTLDGTGPIVDLGQTDLAKQQLEFLDGQLKTLDDRLKAAKDPAGKAGLESMLKEMKARRAEQAKKVLAPAAKGVRTLKNEWLVLGKDVADDAALKAEVLKIDPAYSGTH